MMTLERIMLCDSTQGSLMSSPCGLILKFELSGEDSPAEGAAMIDDIQLVPALRQVSLA